MTLHREAKFAETIAHLAGEFFAREASPESLITVTRAIVSPDLKTAMVFISVLPESAEEKALAFAKRERSALRDFLKQKSAIHFPPLLDVTIDYGEKNRRHIDDLTRGGA